MLQKTLTPLIVSLSLIAGTAHAQDAEARKLRSLDYLRTQGITGLPNLPARQDERASARRTTDEVTDRALALLVVSVAGAAHDTAASLPLEQEFGLRNEFTIFEDAYLDNPQPPDQDHFNMSWRFEAAYVLLWAIGIYGDLPAPGTLVSEDKIISDIRGIGAKDIRSMASLRPQSELLDAADLLYRYDLACIDSWQTGAPYPPGTDCEIVMEWRYALDWLTVAPAQDWDNVSLDY